MSARPATRVGRWLLFPGGHVRRMGLVEYAAVRLRLKTTVARGHRDGQRRDAAGGTQ